MRILAMKGRSGGTGECGGCISSAISLKLVGILEKILRSLSICVHLLHYERLNGDRGKGRMRKKKQTRPAMNQHNGHRILPLRKQPHEVDPEFSIPELDLRFEVREGVYMGFFLSPVSFISLFTPTLREPSIILSKQDN